MTDGKGSQQSSIQYTPVNDLDGPKDEVMIRTTDVKPPALKDYTILAKFALCCCAIPFGIIALIYSRKVRKRFEAGNPEGAKQAARKARSWAIAGVVFGLVNLVFNIVVTILFFKGVGIFGDMKEQMGF